MHLLYVLLTLLVLCITSETDMKLLCLKLIKQRSSIQLIEHCYPFHMQNILINYVGDRKMNESLKNLSSHHYHLNSDVTDD